MEIETNGKLEKILREILSNEIGEFNLLLTWFKVISFISLL